MPEPTTYAQFKTWLGDRTSTVNMAELLSINLSAMELSVLKGFVDGTRMIYAPGAVSANPQGFASVNSLMSEADAELAQHGNVPQGTPFYPYQSVLNGLLDQGNTDQSFVQAGPCPFNF